jgi:hypothetical protein
MPDSRDGLLARASEPQMTVIEKKVDPMLLWLDGVIDGARTGYLQIGDAQLEATRSAFVRTYLSGHLNRRFLCEL